MGETPQIFRFSRLGARSWSGMKDSRLPCTDPTQHTAATGQGKEKLHCSQSPFGRTGRDKQLFSPCCCQALAQTPGKASPPVKLTSWSGETDSRELRHTASEGERAGQGRKAGLAARGDGRGLEPPRGQASQQEGTLPTFFAEARLCPCPPVCLEEETRRAGPV